MEAGTPASNRRRLVNFDLSADQSEACEDDMQLAKSKLEETPADDDESSSTASCDSSEIKFIQRRPRTFSGSKSEDHQMLTPSGQVRSHILYLLNVCAYANFRFSPFKALANVVSLCKYMSAFSP